MKHILIISATKGNNLVLARELKPILDNLGVQSNIISLEDFVLPLYYPGILVDGSRIESVENVFLNSDGLLFCAPEYNGGVPPILSNAIAWLSVSSKNWRDTFNGKIAQLASHSGGPGTRFLSSFRSQLEHMGTTVMARTLSVTDNSPLKIETAERVLSQFVMRLK